jgi:protein-tyrosine phosphatase
MKICFVCLGNIVRSPLAEHMFRHLASLEEVADNYHVESRGTSAYHIGESPDARMRRVARQHGLIYDGQARQFRREDFAAFDLIIAMDQSNRRNLERTARTSEEAGKIRLMRDFDPQAGSNEPVPDPYYGGMDGFERVFEIVQRSCRGLLEELERERSS